MTTPSPEQPQQPAPPAAQPAPQPGFIGRLEEKILPHAEAAAATAKTITAELSAGIQEHSGVAWDVAGDVVNLLKVIDPNDDAAVAALAALLPKAVTLAASAARIAGAVL